MKSFRIIRNIISLMALMGAMLILFCAAFGQTNDELFATANELYASQQYEQALNIYKQIEDSGTIAPELFYNMGNCAFRLQRIGTARGYYERAVKYGLKNDEDVALNLNFVRSMLTDPEPEKKQTWVQYITNIFSLNTWLIIGLACYTLIFVVAGTALFKGTFSTAAKILIVLLIVCNIIAAAAFINKKENPENCAVISAIQADIMHTPSYTGNTFFTLHEGTKVRLLQTDGNWALIYYADGQRGWVETESILTI